MDDCLDPQLIDAARRVVEANLRARRCVAVAESCTGGMVAAAITSVPGSSAMFEAGIVSYANEAKLRLLGVDHNILETFGSVSVATAWAMAQGMLDRTTADVAVAITGIAGPDGGSDAKPVGTVVFARAIRGADPDDVTADTRQFGNLGRGPIRLQAALCALELLLP